MINLLSLYAAEEKTGQIFTAFAIVAVLIASLGLFGLVAFTTEQRTREIGIRKVLGASSIRCCFFYRRNFFAGEHCIYYFHSFNLVGHAQLAEQFCLSHGYEWWIFAAGGLLAIVIALITISFQSIKAAVANPVKSLRTE